MKMVSILLGVFALVLLALLLHQYSVTGELHADLGTLTRDSNEMRGELRKLNSVIAELKKTSAAPELKSVEIPRTAPVKDQAQHRAEPVASPGITVTAPAGWWKNGKNPENYVVGVDTLQTWGGMPSAYVMSVGDAKDAFGGMMQTASADNYSGKRVRLSGWVRAEDANDGGGHLWLRIDGQERGQMLGFDNMDNRPVKGTVDWQEASIVLDVPSGASSLAYGFFIQGGGKMWVSGQTIEVVGPEVPTTNMLKAKNAGPKTPTNLGFDPNRPK